ncbi:hypothetical protein RUND412_003055 [Rhizina undulata]
MSITTSNPSGKEAASSKYHKSKWNRFVKSISKIFTSKRSNYTAKQESIPATSPLTDRKLPETPTISPLPSPATLNPPTSPAAVPTSTFLTLTPELSPATVTLSPPVRTLASMGTNAHQNQNLWSVSAHPSGATVTVPDSLINFYSTAQASGAEWIWAEYGTDTGLLIPVHSNVEVGRA